MPVPVQAVGNGMIAGQVSDNYTSNAIEGTLVLVYAQGSPTPGWNGTTIADGTYDIAVPEGSNYQVTAVIEGFISGQAGGKNVTANDTTIVNFSLVPGGIIRGTVTNNASSPLQNASVQAYLPAAPGTVFTSLASDASGNYSVTVPPGPGYTVVVNKQGFASANQTDVSVAPDVPIMVNFVLQAPAPPPNLPPGDIIDLAAGNPTPNSVPLTWTAPGSDNFTGQASLYDIRYAATIINNNDAWNSAIAAANITLPYAANTTENFIVTGLSANTTYFFAIKTRDEANNWSGLSNSPSAMTTTAPPGQEPPPPQGNPPPGNIIDLVAGNPTSNNVTLTWTAPGSDNFTGQASAYDIRYAIAVIDSDSKFSTATIAPAIPPPHTANTSESFIVTGLNANTTYFFAIKTRDEANVWSSLSNSPSATTAQAPPTPNFSILHSQNKSSFMLAAGANITESINIISINGFQGTVNLNLGGPPEIANNSSVTPNQVILAAGDNITISLRIGASAMTPSGTYQCGLNGNTAAYGGMQRSFFFTIIIGVPGQPMLSASPPVISAGSQTNFFASQFPSSANITLKWDSGPSAGLTISSGQTAGDGTWNVPVIIPAEAPGGVFTVKATAGAAFASCQLTITSGAGPDFLISTSPQFVSVTPGQSANVTVYVASVNGFSGLVNLSAGNAPGVTRTFSTANVTPASGETASAILTIAVAEWASPGMYQLNVEGACASPLINKMTNINLDIQSPAAWGPGISLSQSYAMVGETITVSGANFPSQCNGQTVTIKEANSNTILATNPATITVSNGSFTGTFIVPSGIPSGNYRIKAIVESTGDFAERDFQILGAGETFSMDASPPSTTLTTEEGGNSSMVSINIFSMGGNNPTVNLALEGVPGWLTYQIGSLPANTPASGDNAISVPAGGSTSRNLSLTASLTASTGTYMITIKGWVTGGSEHRIPLQITVQPAAGFGMAQLTLNPTFGQADQTVSFSGTGFTNCTPGQVTEFKFGGIDIITGQNLPTITVPVSGDAAGRFSGTFRVPSALNPGTYAVEIRVGSSPNDKFINRPFTITGGGDTFVLQASPSFLWVEQGGQIHTMIQIQATGSSSATVILSLEGYPTNDIIASLASNNITASPGGTASTDLTLNAQSWLPAGHYTITIKGQSSGGAEVHRIPLEMDVAPPAGLGMASIYLNPTVGSVGTWVTISGNGFPTSASVTHLYLGSPNPENDWVTRLPAIVTNGSGAFTAVLQVPASMPAGMYPVEVVVGIYPADRRASAQFTLFSGQASFNISLSPMNLQAAPGAPVSTSVNIQSVGSSSANITLRVEGPPTIEWRFDGGTMLTPKTVTPAIGGSLMSSLEIQPKASTPMGHYSLAVKATAGEQTEMRNLEIDIGASAAYNMPILSLNPNMGMAGTNIAFSGSNFPASANITGITFGSANITLAQIITTSAQGSFSGAFTVPATMGGQPIASGTYPVRVSIGQLQAEMQFNVYGSDDTFTLNLSPNFLQGGPGTESRTSGSLKALGSASPTVKMAVRGLPPGVDTTWNGIVQQVYILNAPPGGQNNFELGLVLPGMISMGQYPAVLEGWVDDNQNNTWDNGEKIVRVNLNLSVMPPQGYNMGMISLSPSYGRVGDTITISGSGFPASTAVQSLTFAQFDILSNAITTAADGSFSGIFVVPETAFGNPTGPGRYPVDIIIGTPSDERGGGFEFQVISSNQNFSIDVSPGWLARPAGDIGSVNIAVRSQVATPPSPTVSLRVEGLPMGVTPSFVSANITPPIGNMESRELLLTISKGTPTGNYPISIRAYNAANPAEEIWINFTLEVTPSSGFSDMGMAMITLSPNFGSAGDQVTVSGYGFPKNQTLTRIRFGPNDVTPSVVTTTDATGAFSAVITVPTLPSGPHPIEVNVQNTIRNIPFNIMGAADTYTLNVSPNWLEPVPAGDPNGRQIAITVNALPGKMPAVTLSAEGLFAAYGTITQVWNPVTRSVSVTSAGDVATATLTLIASENLPPGPYPFNIVAVDGSNNRREFHMEFHVGPPANFMGGMMGMDQTAWDDQWHDTQWEGGIFFPEIMLSPRSGPAGTQVTYTGTNLPAGANVTNINFAGHSVPLPPSGMVADASGGFSGSFIVDESWGLAAGGMYFVNFHLEKDIWWQDIGKDYNLTRPGASFSLEANPNYIPPIPQDGYGQTIINVKALGYNSANVTLGIMEAFGGMGIPGGSQAHWNNINGPVITSVSVPGGGQTSANFYLDGAASGHFMITIVGWIDSNDNQILEPSISSEAESAFSVPLNFDVQPPQAFKNWDMDAMMGRMGMDPTNKYLFYFPEIVLNPNVGQADTKVTITATDFPVNANVTHLRFARMELPVPAGTAADSNGDFSLVFNVPKTMWSANTGSGWYDVEIEAQKAGEPSVYIVKQFQVTASDVAFTLNAEPNWLPPIPPEGNGSTLIRVLSVGSAANVTLSVDKIPPGIDTAFSSNVTSVTPGGSGTATLTLTPVNIPPGHYSAEIKGTAIIDGAQKEFFTHLEFDVQPATIFKDESWMEDNNIWFPEITLNPTAGQVKTKVTVTATDFPASANITHLRFAGRELPVPANTAADDNGDVSLVFNIPGDLGVGQYMVEVEAQKTGLQPIFIAKPFFVEDAGVTFKLNAVPGFIPGIPQGSSGNTTVFIQSTGQAVTVQLYVDGLPPNVTATFENSTLNVPPGSSISTRLTITTRAATPPGQYPLTIRGVSGAETRMAPFGLGVMSPASFQMPKFTINPDYAPAGYNDKQYKITFSGNGFPANRSVSSLTFGSQSVAIPANLTTDANGNFNGVFQMPIGLASGTYDVRVAVSDGSGGFIYDSRPFSIRGAQAKFILKLSPPYLPPVLQGGQGTTIINVQSVGTTSANVTLYVDGLAPGITASFTPSNIITVTPGVTGITTLTINVAANTPPGPYSLSVRGISGAETIVIPLGFSVMPKIGVGEGSAAISINPAQARPGEHIGISGAGFTGNYTIILTAAPPGSSTPINITPGTITVQSDGTWATEITVPPAGQVPPGAYVIKASDGVKAARSPFNIVPATATDFFLTVSPQYIEVVRGQSGNTSMKITSKNGFTEAIRFKVGNLAPGVTATFRDSSGNIIAQYMGAPGGIREIVAPTALTPVPGEDLNVTATINVDVATPLGPYDIPLEVRTATLARAIPLGLTVVSTGANLVVTPQGGAPDTEIRISGSGYTAGETVTITFANNNITTIPATVAAAQDRTFSAVIITPPMNAGIYPIKARGATSGITIIRPFSLKPTPASNFVLYAMPQKVDISKGSSGAVTVKIEPMGSFQSNVTLTISGLAAISGATSSFTPSATIVPSIGTPTTATLTITIPAGAAEGKYPLVITGTSGSITQARNITVNVVPPGNTPDFAINLAPNAIPINANASGNVTVTITALNGFTGTVTLSIATSSATIPWPTTITYATSTVTPSANTGLGKQDITFTAAADTQPGSWTFRVTGTSGALSHSTDVMVICTPSGTTSTAFSSPLLDPATVTSSTPIDMTAPWGDKITINGIINDGSEASVITPTSFNVTPETLAALPAGATDMLGRITNIESSTPVDDAQWEIGFPFDPADLTAAGLEEKDLKVIYLNPDTNTWTEVTTVIDTTNKIAYASPTHFSSWSLIASAAPPVSQVVTQYGGGGGAPGFTELTQYIDRTGKITRDVTAKSYDNMAQIAISKNTVAKTQYGQTLYVIGIQQQTSYPAAPADTSIIGQVYDFYPSGATFSLPVNLTFTYTDAQIPAKASEDNLFVASWQSGKWVEVAGATIDKANNLITVSVRHFTVFTVMAHTVAASFEISDLEVSPSAVHPDETVTVSTTVANNGDLTGSCLITFRVNGEVSDTEIVNLAGHASQKVSFTLKPPKADVYTLDVNGKTATLTVSETTVEKPEATPAEATTTPSKAETPTATTAPAEVQPTPSTTPPATATITPAASETPAVPEVAQTPAKKNNLWFILIGIIAAGIIAIALVYWRTRRTA
jgi:uncharacterized membrane protein